MVTAKPVETSTDEDIEAGTVTMYVPNPKQESPERIAIRQSLAAYPLRIRRFVTEELIHLDVTAINRAIANLPTEMPSLVEYFKQSIGGSKVKAKTFKTVYEPLDEAFMQEALNYVIELRKLYR